MIINKIWELTIYVGPIIGFLACMALFARTRKIGFRILGIAGLAYLLPLLLQHLAPHLAPWVYTALLLVINLAVMAGWVVLAVEFMVGRSAPAAAGIAASRTPACAHCNAPLDATSRFCAKCGHATGT